MEQGGGSDLTFYVQNALGYSPLQGGLRLLPATVLTFIVPLLTRRLAGRAPGLLLGGGLGVTALGLAVIHGVTASSEWTALLAGLLLTGAGTGLANPAIANIVIGVVAPERIGMASAISNTSASVDWRWGWQSLAPSSSTRSRRAFRRP